MMAGTDVTIINGGGLQVSHTSVMPEIKGIQGLVYMIFANDRRLRKLESDRATSSISGNTDSLESRYTGALFGLGYDNVTQLPIYKEHDYEHAFSVHIDDKDVEDGDKIRKKMIMFSYTNEHAANTNRSEQDVQHAQRDLRESIRLFLNRKRQSVMKKTIVRALQWEMTKKK